ncbi:c-type cytochrome [Effusibacillus lacus]|uniref:Cytochrome c domain-containing protein n=1 Tax=Effusibacillus lacus TaxID=1348429 RepID=A0A292YDN4_9BACL|nr:cytochrome c [Effusibacillus lacus]TCS76602.1 cytochrome c553 [Effusibacillus lacus]GAX90382.1 hypothetical protein EFBL_2008 [Effusibacillus lacus]
MRRKFLAGTILAILVLGAVAYAMREPEPSFNSGDTAKGKELYDVYCAACHGLEGKGKPTGSALNTPEYLKNTSDEQIWNATAYGIPGTTMGPALKGQGGVKQLSEREISHIVAYLRSLQK